jgi:hypothetical protein
VTIFEASCNREIEEKTKLKGRRGKSKAAHLGLRDFNPEPSYISIFFSAIPTISNS